MLAHKIRPMQDVMRMHAADPEQNIKQQWSYVKVTSLILACK